MKTLYPVLLSLSLVVGCDSKKEDPTPDPTPSVADAQLTCFITPTTYTGTAKARYTPASTNGTGTVDLLVIDAQKPTSNSAAEYITVYYGKPKGSADSEYKLQSVRYEGTTTTNYGNEPVGTLRKTSKGWSGTFSAKRISPSSTIVVEKGEFSNVPE